MATLPLTATIALPIPVAEPPLLPGWTRYKIPGTEYTLSYPQTWRVHEEGGLDRPIFFYSPEPGSAVEVNVWEDMAAQPGFDLLDWVNARPEALLFADSTEPVTYNATMLGQPAVFHYNPATRQTYDTSMLIFAHGEHCFRIIFYSHAIPSLKAEVAIYLQMLESFSIPGSPAGDFSIPTGWEQGAGLITRIDPPTPAVAGLSPDELLPYRQGLVGKVEDWDDDRIYDVRFTLLTDDGHRYSIYGESFCVHFRGRPIDYSYHAVPSRPQNGDRVRVAGQPLASGEVLVQYIAIETGGEWQTWFHRTLFDVTRDEFDPLLLSNYPQGEMVWLQGPLEQTLALLADELGDPIGSERFSQHLEQEALAHGALRANGDFRVQLENLYVQEEGECTVSDCQFYVKEHCPFWQQLYPAVSATTSITATVRKSVPEARVIVLEQPVDGFATITLTPDGQLLTEDGQPAAWEEVVAGVQVKASGEAGATGTLLAHRVQIIRAAPPTPTATPPAHRFEGAILTP